MPINVMRWPDKGQDFSKLAPAFPLQTDNPIGRVNAEHTMKSHNQLVERAGTGLNTKEAKHLKKYRAWRKSNPTFGLWGMDTLHEKYMKGVNDDVMGTSISRATIAVDTKTPAAWGMREWSDQQREKVLKDPMYLDSKGYEIQWSIHEAGQATRQLDMFERSKHAKGYLKCHGMTEEGHTTVQFRKWRNSMRQTRLDRPLIIEPPYPMKEGTLPKYPPTAAFPGPGPQTPVIANKSAVDLAFEKKKKSKLSTSHYQMTTRLQVSGKITAKQVERFDDEEEEMTAQKTGMAAGTIHARFGKHAARCKTGLDDVDPNAGVEQTEGAAQAKAAREYLLNQLITSAQQTSMQCASNDRVRALLVKQNQVREATNANRQLNEGKTRPHTSGSVQLSQGSKRGSTRGGPRASTRQTSRASTRQTSRASTSQGNRESRIATEQAALRRQSMQQEHAQLNANVQAAVTAGQAVAKSVIDATGQMLRARPTPVEETEYMYKARALVDLQSHDAAMLSVQQGDTIYVFEDDEYGCFECMDEHGIVGKVPNNAVQFEEAVPKMRPCDMRTD